jgi:periplasmic protein TonB
LKVVIDKTGRVKNIVIVHPLGMGLDDNAVATVSRWQFSPATHDGQPVAMSVYVEVDFHLY